MDVRDYLRVVRRGWPTVLALLILGTALGVGATLATKKVYQADVQIFVATSKTGDATALANGNTFVQDRVQSYTSIANSPDVTGPVVTKLKLGITQQQLSSKISADAPLNKVLINLHVTDQVPTTARDLANAVAKQFDSQVQRTEQTDAAGKPAVKLTVIHPAEVPSTPIKPNRLLNVALGLILGVLIGITLVFLRDVLDNTVKGPEDFEPMGVPVLGYVPFDKSTEKSPIAFRDDPHSTRSEAYRQLRTSLQFVNVDSSPRIIAVTSAVPGEGKTTTAINLAAALAEGGYRVCLIEADLRRPNIAKLLGLVGDVGFTTALVGRASVESVLQNAGQNLAVLTSGPVPPNPSELLLTAQARAIIMEVASMVDYTIIDTAPLLPVVDAADVAVLADATIVVHRAGKSTREQAQRSVDALAKVGEKPVGVVLNMVTRGRGRYDEAYGYYYVYRPDKSADESARDAVSGAANRKNGTGGRRRPKAPADAAAVPAGRGAGADAPTEVRAEPPTATRSDRDGDPHPVPGARGPAAANGAVATNGAPRTGDELLPFNVEEQEGPRHQALRRGAEADARAQRAGESDDATQVISTRKGLFRRS